MKSNSAQGQKGIAMKYDGKEIALRIPSHEECAARERADNERRRARMQDELNRQAEEANRRAAEGPRDEDMQKTDERIAYLRENANVPPIHRHATLDVPRGGPGNFDQVVADLKALLLRPETIVLCGADTYRAGKSHVAAATVNYFVENGKSALYSRAFDILGHLSDARFSSSRMKVMAQYQQPELLVIDEIGVKGDTPFDDQCVRSLIDHRHAYLKPTIICCNLGRKSLGEVFERAIIERITERGAAVEISWPPYWWKSNAHKPAA